MTGFGLQPFGTSPFGGGGATDLVPIPGVLDPDQYELLRGPHFSYGYVEAWYDGSPLEVEIDGRVTTRLPLVDGSVEVDATSPGARRVLSAAFSPLPGLEDLLSRVGTELRAFLVVRGPDGVEHTTAQGVFDIDVLRAGYGVNGDLKVTAPDRWKRLMDARFFTPRAPAAGVTNRQQIALLIDEVMPAGVTTVDVGSSAVKVPAQVWDRDRDKAVEDLARAASLDVFFDRDGFPIIRDAPVIDPDAVAWVVDAGEFGVLVDADRERNRQRTYNIVVVNGTANDGVAPFPPAFVWDNDPNSPTYAGPGSGFGEAPPALTDAVRDGFGQRPAFYSSPLLRNLGQAFTAGRTVLDRVSGLAAQLTLSTVPNPGLSDGATVLVLLPGEYPGAPLRRELHIVDRMSVPLRPSASNPQRIYTRSTLAGFEDLQ